jgi:hypothetical protein
LSRQIYRQHVHPALNVLLARHFTSTHQLRAFRHDRVHHHRRDRDYSVSARIEGREFALVGLALKNQIVPAVGCVAAVAQLPAQRGPEDRDEGFWFSGGLGDALRDGAA